MQILELESKTGLDRATIRHYEKEGLINPTRRENGYRDYTEENINDLLKIKLLRQLGLSLDKIRKIKQGSDNFSDTLAEQIRILQQQINLAQRAKDVCSQMLKDGVTYRTMDAQTYIDQLTQQRSLTFPKQFHEPIVVRPFHPVRRYVARMLDYNLLSVLIFSIVFVVLRVRPARNIITGAISYAIPFVALVTNAILLSKLGTTPGKWLMGLEVKSVYGGNMHFDGAFSREWEVLFRGYGLGIPLVSPILQIIRYRNYYYRDLDWDEYCEYIYHTWTTKRKIAFVLAILMLFLSFFACAIDLYRPKYRGDLTVSEFSSNFNDYLDYMGDYSSDSYLDEDGHWKEPTENMGQGVIVIGAKSKTDPIQFTLEGENITGLTFHKTWTEINFSVAPLGDIPQILMLSMIMAQRGSGYADMRALEDAIGENATKNSGSIVCNNIEISWRIIAENCVQLTDGSYYVDEKEEESRVELFLEINKQ